MRRQGHRVWVHIMTMWPRASHFTSAGFEFLIFTMELPPWLPPRAASRVSGRQHATGSQRCVSEVLTSPRGGKG